MDIYKRYYTVEQVKTITGLVQPESVNNKLLHPAYLGGGYFDKEKLDSILDYEQEKDWFVKQIQFFVEYLNKAELILYSDIAKKVTLVFFFAILIPFPIIKPSPSVLTSFSGLI